MLLEKGVIRFILSFVLVFIFTLPVVASPEKVKISENQDFIGNVGKYIINNHKPKTIWNVITDQNGFKAICKVLERIEL